MDKVNIAVFPAGTEIGLEINNALKYVKDINLIGISGSVDHSHYVYSETIIGAPFIGYDGLFDFLSEVISKKKIDFIIPAHDDACVFLTEHEDSLGVKVVSSGAEAARICRYKSVTYKTLAPCDFLPFVFSGQSIDSIPFPIFIKPDRGQGAKGARVICSKEELAQVENLQSYILCENLSGKEFTVDCISDAESNLLYSGVRQRERIKSGISVSSSNMAHRDDIAAMAKYISKKIGLKGAWFFQLKEDKDGQLKLMEVACRIAGTMGMYRNRGINFPLASLYIARGFDVQLINNNFDLKVDRALISRYTSNINFSRAYIDFDDTIITGKNINADMMRFIYQCVNKGISLYLITRHIGDIDGSLEKYQIHSGLFKEVIHLQQGEKKSRHINPDSSIFIDDSFAERKDVAESLGIPVFDIDALEMLIDWRS